MRTLFWLLILSLTITTQTGCKQLKALDAKEKVNRLDASLRHYGADLRWGRYRDAYSLHVNRLGEPAVFDLNRMENFSITDFLPVKPVVNEEGTEATIPVEIDYYDEHYGTLKKIKYTQDWWFNLDTGRWYIDSPFPDFR